MAGIGEQGRSEHLTLEGNSLLFSLGIKAWEGSRSSLGQASCLMLR